MLQAVLPQRLLLLARGRPEHAADLRASGEQERRLPPDDVEVLLLGEFDDAVLRELVDLALDDAQRDVAEQPDDFEVVLRQRQRHRLEVEEVAEQHRDMVAPPRMRRLAPAPQLGLVDDVVVDERRGVDELDAPRRTAPRARPCNPPCARPSAGPPGESACRRRP